MINVVTAAVNRKMKSCLKRSKAEISNNCQAEVVSRVRAYGHKNHDG